MLHNIDNAKKIEKTKNDSNGKFKLNSYSSLHILFIYNAITILSTLVFYPILPIIMNYPADLFEYSRRYSISYLPQYIIILTTAMIAGSVVLRKALRGIDGWEDLLKDECNEKYEKLKVVRKKCINLPYIIYIVQIFFLVVPLIVVFGIIVLINGTPIIILVKVVVAVFSLFSLASIISMIYSKRIFTKILLKTYSGEACEGVKIGIKNKVFLQILPMFIVSILFTSLIGYSRLVDSKGDSLFTYNKAQLMEKFKDIRRIEKIDQIKKILSRIELNSYTITFIIDPKGNIVTSDGSILSNYYIVSIKDFADKNNGRVYDEIGLTNLTLIKIKGNDGMWVIGLKYKIITDDVNLFFLINFFVLLLINIFVLYYLSKSISGEISLVAKSLTEIAEGILINLDNKIPVTSNDEIGDLVIAFNKIQDLQEQNKRVIDEKNEELTAMNEELIAANNQLQDYASTAEELAVTKERNRFARDIHDTLGHTLTLLVKMLEVSAITSKTDIDKTETDIQKAVEIAREGLKDIKRSISGLSSLKLEKNNFVTALEELMVEFSQNSGIDIHFSADGIDMNLSSVYTDNIYKTCQEALTNAVRHGNATRIVIILRGNKDNIKLNILDDGSGCKQINKGFGLSGMEQRIKELYGSLVFSSTEEGGFNIIVEIPKG